MMACWRSNEIVGMRSLRLLFAGGQRIFFSEHVWMMGSLCHFLGFCFRFASDARIAARRAVASFHPSIVLLLSWLFIFHLD